MSGSTTSSDLNLAFSGVSSLGTAAQDLFASEGSEASVASFQKAASIADTEADLEKQSTQIQEMQQKRQTMGVIGQQQAEVAGAGLAESGSALQLLASSTQQASLTTALTGVQGQILTEGYQQQSAAYTAQAQAAQQAASAQKTGGLLSGLAGVAQIGASAALFFGA